MSITPSGYAHVRLTVTDIVRSRAFYDDVFGFPVAFQVPPDADEATRAALGFLYGGVIYKLGDGLFLKCVRAVSRNCAVRTSGASCCASSNCGAMRPVTEIAWVWK